MAEWTKIINEGRILINDNRCGDTNTIKAGDTITYDPGDFEEPEANLSYSIIFEDEWILAVDKPANLLVHRAGRSFRNNLVYQLRCVNTPPYPGCHPVHRLDRDTSGVVLIAKNSEVMKEFAVMFNEGRITKIYRAIIGGQPDFKTPFMIDSPISADKNSGVPFKFKVCDNGKPASTTIEDVRHLDNGLSMLTIKPLTGRTHQIRVHLAAAGFPIVGDKTYGSSEHCGFSRQALHCESLSFIHPYTGRQCEITAELPCDFF
jgi:RluA family pseudouridine synthase